MLLVSMIRTVKELDYNQDPQMQRCLPYPCSPLLYQDAN